MIAMKNETGAGTAAVTGASKPGPVGFAHFTRLQWGGTPPPRTGVEMGTFGVTLGAIREGTEEILMLEVGKC
jgi:hypothetical protein